MVNAKQNQVSFCNIWGRSGLIWVGFGVLVARGFVTGQLRGLGTVR